MPSQDLHDTHRHPPAPGPGDGAQDELLATLSHDLRGPVGAISAAIEVLDSAPDPETAAEARAIIARQARGLSQLVDGLLDLSRLVAGKATLARAPLDLALLAQRVRQGVTAADAAAGRRLALRVDSAWADVDAGRLEQLLSSLVTDALRSAPATDDVGLAVRRDGGSALIEMQLGARTPGVVRPLARRLVELHGGTLEEQTCAPGKRIRIRLPAVEPVAAPDADALPRQRPRRVLVLGDANGLADLRARLEREGHAVGAAAGGDAGLEQLLMQRPDVVVVDIGLAAGQALALARQARAAGYAGRMIALSAQAPDRELAASARAAGFDACLAASADRAHWRTCLDD